MVAPKPTAWSWSFRSLPDPVNLFYINNIQLCISIMYVFHWIIYYYLDMLVKTFNVILCTYLAILVQMYIYPSSTHTVHTAILNTNCWLQLAARLSDEPGLWSRRTCWLGPTAWCQVLARWAMWIDRRGRLQMLCENIAYYVDYYTGYECGEADDIVHAVE